MHGKDEYLQAIQVLAPRFRVLVFFPENENAGGSAICIHKDLLPEEAIVTHLIICQGRVHLVNIQSGRHSLVFVNVHFELELTLRQLRGRLGLLHPHWPAYPNGVGIILVTSTSVTPKKDDLMSGTRHSPMATRERLPCSTLSFHTSLRLLNLITQGRTPQPLGSYALFQGLIVFFINLPVAEARDFRCSSHVFENLGNRTISDHGAARLVIQKPTNGGHLSKRIPSWMCKVPVFCSLLQQLHDDRRFSHNPFCGSPRQGQEDDDP